MKTQILASVSLLATGLACGASFLGSRPAAESTLPEVEPLHSIGSAPRALLTPADDDPSVRVTPVVKAVQRAADSVVSIYMVDRRSRSADGQGSGVILDESGLVITNWHVVWRALDQSGPYQLQVRLRDKRQYKAVPLSASSEHDLALLQLELKDGERVQPMMLGDSSDLLIGETVVAIGNPQGHANTVTSGVLSAEDRSIKVRAPDGRVRSYSGLLQTDAAINQGNSGGALLDITGKLIGINNAMAAAAENIGFAIPVDTVKRVFQEVLLGSDNLASVWIGMRVQDRDGAVLVSEVDPEGPAARAGVRKGDRVLSANGEKVANGVDYARRVLGARPGQSFPLQMERSGRPVTLKPVPLSNAAYELVRRIGVEVETVEGDRNPALVEAASKSFYGGINRRRPMLPSVVRVRRVHADSPAAALLLEAGDILLGFRQESYWDYRDVPFVSEQNLAEWVRGYAGRRMPVFVLRGDKEMEGGLFVRR